MSQIEEESVKIMSHNLFYALQVATDLSNGHHIIFWGWEAELLKYPLKFFFVFC